SGLHRHRNPDVGNSHLRAVKVSRGNANNGETLAIQRNGRADYALIRPEPSLPETMTENGDRTLQSDLAFFVEKSATDGAAAAEKCEVVVGDHEPVDFFNVAAAAVKLCV